MKLEETFKSPESRVEHVVMFADMAGSTAMKVNESEAGWLTSLGWFYDLLLKQVVSEEGGRIVKFLGDGMFAVYASDKASEAINTAIRIQEALDVAVRKDHVHIRCSIGITTGKIVRFTNAQGQEDFVGSVVDKAARLCAAAAQQAIFIDETTAEYTHWPKVSSRRGVAEERTTKEYKGELRSVKLKGFSSHVKYHQIHWHNQEFGVKPEYAEDLAEDNEKKERHQELLELGVRLWKSGDRSKAYETLQKSAGLGNEEALNNIHAIAKILAQEGDVEDAVKALKWAAQRGHRESIELLEGLQTEDN